MKPVLIAPIVEGHGEIAALPALLHRLAAIAEPRIVLRVNPPLRVKSGSFLNDAPYFQKSVSLAGAKAAQAGGTVLILLDCEDTCPGTLGPSLLRRARSVRSDVAILVVLAYREFESWFIAAARSLRGCRGLPANLEPPTNHQSIRDAKGWLGARMAEPYDPIIHQIEMARAFDLQEAASNVSFRRFRERIEGVLRPKGIE